MKIYSLNPISVHQEDKNVSVKAYSPAQGMFLDTPQRLSEVPNNVREDIINRMEQAEGAYQMKENVENNRFTNSMIHRKEAITTNENPREIIKPDTLDVREDVSDGNATTVQAAGNAIDNDFCYEMRIPNGQSLYIYNKCMHKSDVMKGGLIQPENSSNDVVIAGSNNLQEDSTCSGISSSLKSDSIANGISFSEGVSSLMKTDSIANGIAFNDRALDNILNSLNENKNGGAIPAIVGQLALQLIPQIPAIISAIKNKRDDKQVGNGLLINMQKYPTVRAVMKSLPEGKSASYYNDIIKEFNAFKRSASGISFNEGEGTYYASGKVTDGIKKFFGWIRDKYNQNKEVFKPIRDALVNAANNTLQNAVDSGTKKVTDYVKSKTDNKDIHRIVDAATDVTQAVTDETKKRIDQIGNGIQPDKIFSVLN